MAGREACRDSASTEERVPYTYTEEANMTRTMTRIWAATRGEAAAILRDARSGGGVVVVVCYGAHWIIDMGAGGCFELSMRP